MKKILAFVAVSTLMATSAMADEPVMSKFNMSIGGYIKLDYAYNSENLGQSGTITPSGAGLNIASESPAGQQKQSILGIRQSRLWVKVNGPDAMGAKTGALIEGDFYGDASAAAEPAIPRAFGLRHSGLAKYINPVRTVLGYVWADGCQHPGFPPRRHHRRTQYSAHPDDQVDPETQPERG